MPEQKVRRAPHATTGEPWPMPQYYTTKKNKVYKINREKFQFRIVKESCDIIEKAVIRYKDVIINDTILDMYDNLQHAQGSSFEDVEVKYEKDMYRRAPYLEVVTIKIRKPCVKLPSDKMDESCKCNMS
jgi:hexosaminidase